MFHASCTKDTSRLYIRSEEKTADLPNSTRLKNTIHSIVAGIYGSWFFCAGKPGGMPSGATRGAARRAFTYSFGSISFGSLVVALINMVRQAVSIAQQQEAQGGNIAASIAFCLLGCIIGLIDWAVQ